MIILTEVVRVSKKYQIVIPKQARKALNINPGDNLIVSVRGKQILMRPRPKNYTEYMRGLHKEVWKGVKVTKYIKEEREAWI